MNKIRRGKGFRGVVSYALNPASHHLQTPIVIGGNMLGFSVDEITEEFNRTCNLRKDVQKPVWHNSLRLPKGDCLSNNEWKVIADDYMNRMGFSDTHLRCYVLHDDKDGQHIHIIASRINVLNSQLYLGRNENLISTKIIQELEVKYNLKRTVGPLNLKSKSLEREKATRNELMMEKRTGEPSPKKVIQNTIDKILTNYVSLDLDKFIRELSKHSIQTIPNISSTGKMNGFSFEYNGIAFKGSKIGKAYSWSNLSNKISINAKLTESIIIKKHIEESLQSAYMFQCIENNNECLGLEIHSIKENSLLKDHDSDQPVILLPADTLPKVKNSESTLIRWLLWIPYLDSLQMLMKKFNKSFIHSFNKLGAVKDLKMTKQVICDGEKGSTGPQVIFKSMKL
ncbi:relaxase/mobilization nuclease domain-containing protein [Serratia symbiotica]|uniref:relaxase/mobilization nuclease domain-containing protein n=1 Tax=Serratia symbiotica TaxID=138074 RepID=UPI003013747C